MPTAEFVPDWRRLRHTVNLLEADGFGRQGGKLDFAQFISLPPDTTADYLQENLGNLISGLIILDSDGPYGVFNRHDLSHLQNVNSIAHSLLDESQRQQGIAVADIERNITTGISLLHDIGNNISRKHHGEISAYLFSKIFTNYSSDDQAVRTILAGIRLHDEPEGVKLSDLKEIAGNEHTGVRYPGAVFAAIAGDKLDVGRHRLSTAMADQMVTTFDRIVEETPHTLVVLYARKSQLVFSPDGGKASWEIDFSTDVSGEDRPEIRRILQNFIWKDDDIYVPRSWHYDWKNRDIPYSVSYFGNMRQLYCTRLALMFSSLFALLPKLDTVEVVISDKKPYIGTRIVSEYQRDNWQDILFMVWKKMNRDNYLIGVAKPPQILKIGEQHYEQRKGYSV